MSPETQSFLETQRLEVAQILLESGCILLDFEKGHTFSTGIKSPIKVDCERLKDSPEHFEKIVSKLDR